MKFLMLFFILQSYSPLIWAKGTLSCHALFNDEKRQSLFSVSQETRLHGFHLQNLFHQPKKSVEEPYAKRRIQWNPRQAKNPSPILNPDGSLKRELLGHFSLALENGRTPIRDLRLHLAPPRKFSTVFSKRAAQDKLLFHLGEFIQDLKPFFDGNPSANLSLVFPRGNHWDVHKVVETQLGNEFLSRTSFFELHRNSNGFSTWSRDASKALDEGGLLLPAKFRQSGRQLRNELRSSFRYLEDFAKSRSRDFWQSLFYFEGGNMVVGDRHIFIGVDMVLAAMKNYRLNYVQAVEALSLEFGKPVFPIGEVRKEVSRPNSYVVSRFEFHADLTLGVGVNQHSGREVIFLASAQKAIDFYRAELKKIASGKSFFQLDSKLLAEELAVVEHLFQRDFSQRKVFNQNLKARLVKEGYQAVEIPTFRVDRRFALRTDFPEHVNYVNSVFSGDLAVIPQLGLPLLDGHVRQLFEQQGYKVVSTLRTARDLLKYCGGPSCAMAIERGVGPSSLNAPEAQVELMELAQ